MLARFALLAFSLLSCYLWNEPDTAFSRSLRLSNLQALNYRKRKLTCFASEREVFSIHIFIVLEYLMFTGNPKMGG